MQLLDLTLDSHSANIAMDEALLEAAERTSPGGGHGEVLRLWESPEPIVVIGRSSRVNDEVEVAHCRDHRIQIIRRSSGGAAIVAGPGCLMYAVVLDTERRPDLKMISAAHEFVLGRLVGSLEKICSGVEHQGTSDLALDGRKVSGNSMRCKRRYLLYHGTLLYNFDLPLIHQCLGTAPRQPDYRAGRSHKEFVANLPTDSSTLRQAISAAFGATVAMTHWPAELTDQLDKDKYSTREWNERLL